MPSARAYSGAAGQPLISVTMRFSGMAPVTTRRVSVGLKCWVLKSVKGRSVVATSSTAALRTRPPRKITRVSVKLSSSPAEPPVRGMPPSPS
jgi:hypothetical protein